MYFDSNNSNAYNSDRPPPPPNLLGGLDLAANYHRLDRDPGDPGPPVLPLHAIQFPLVAFDTPNIQALNALKAQVEALADLGSVPFHQSSQVGFDPGLASPDSAGEASSPSASTLPSPTSSMFSSMESYYVSPEDLPSPTFSAFSSTSPSSSFYSRSPSAYSPEEYRSRPSQALDPPILPPAHSYQEGYTDYPAGVPSPFFGSGYGLHPSAFALPPPVMPPESAVPSAASLLPALPALSAFSGMDGIPFPPPQHTDGAQNLPIPPRIEAICPTCGKGMLLARVYGVVLLRISLMTIFSQNLNTRKT